MVLFGGRQNEKCIHHKDLVPNEYISEVGALLSQLVDRFIGQLVADFLDTSPRLKHQLQRKYIRNSTTIMQNSFKYQYMAVAGAGAVAGAEIMDKGGAGAENK